MEITIVVIILLVLFFAVRSSKKKKYLAGTEFKNDILEIKEFWANIEEAKNDYFRNSQKVELKKSFGALYRKLSRQFYQSLRQRNINEFVKTYLTLDGLVQEWNRKYVEDELAKNASLFENIDDKTLDSQQRNAVITDEDNNLIIAGAGSGKTLTISAKVKYLVDRKNVNPDEILLISFTKKAAEEMQDRIGNKLSINVEAKTFHKLGLDIISQAWGKRPDILEDFSKIIDDYFNNKIQKNTKEMQNLITFFGIYLHVTKDLEEFNNLGEAHDHYRNVDFETLKSKVELKSDELKNNKKTILGETVKSLEEVMIANYLFLNGVKYSYETEYPYDTGDPYRKKYRPDFYLDDYDIYLEHFGITYDNRAPWLSEIEEKKYLEEIRWKRELHKDKGTTLLETYSYFNSTGKLYTELDKQLRSHGVAYQEVDYVNIYKRLFIDKKDTYATEFKKLVETFINLYKSKGYSIKDFESLFLTVAKENNQYLKDRTRVFLSIVQPLFVHYQNVLETAGKIDFNDMINMATDIVQNNKTSFKLKYIIVDEYQDISVSRFNLIKHLKEKTNAKVVAVGDDWQSIYRFAGSDIDLFTNFNKYLGFTENLKIEKTYRNPQELIDIAGKFIMQNPKQIKKDLVSSKRNSSPIKIISYDTEFEYALKSAIEQIVRLDGEVAEIMILGRNNFDIDILDTQKESELKVYKSSNAVRVTYSKYPDLKLNFLTVHRSKGLEADNVIVINLENKLLGFPNKISDDPVLSLVLTDLDKYDFAEERRLFYVAITRSRNFTFLIVPDNNQSIFAQEINNIFSGKYETVEDKSIHDNPKCPTCQKGYLVVREKNGSSFLGCSNYPLCSTTFKNTEIIYNKMMCEKCGGYMVERKGKYGSFYGCTNFPLCRNTKKKTYPLNMSETEWEKIDKEILDFVKDEVPPSLPDNNAYKSEKW